MHEVRSFLVALGLCAAIELSSVTARTGSLSGIGQEPIRQDAAFQKVPPPIELSVEPPSISAGGRVEIRGSAALAPNDATVEITVTQPSAREKRALSAHAGSDGAFTVAFDGTAQPGVYRVDAVAAGGKTRGNVTFTVKTIAQVFEEAETVAVELMDTSEELILTLEHKAEELPTSPAKADLIDKLKEITAQIKSAREDAPEWKESTREMVSFTRQYPALAPATRGAGEQISKWNLDAKRHAQRAREEAARLKQANVVCDTMQALQDGFDLAAFLWTFVTKPRDILSHWATEWAPPKLLSALADSVHEHLPNKEIQLAWNVICCARHASHGAGQGEPQSHGTSKHVSVETVQKTIFEGLSYASGKAFHVFCEKFQGPIEASMHAQFDSEDGHMWWEYRIDLTGELAVRYPKNQKSGALTGEFQGYATKFKSWDDAIGVGWPRLTQGGWLFRMAKEPYDGARADWLFGQVHAGNAVKSVLVPAFFKVPIKGSMTDARLEIDLKDAVVDFSDQKTYVTYLISSPLMGMFLAWTKFELPYKDARFILGRAMDDQPAEFPIVTDRAAHTMTISRQFDRVRRADRTRGRYVLAVKACNPGCGAAH